MIYKLSDEQIKRINILKILFTIFVIYIHSKQTDIKFAGEIIDIALPKWFEYYTHFFSEAISRCAVSGFFLMSSFLLYRKEFSWKNNIIKRIKTLIIPYLIMNTFWILAFFIGQQISYTSVFFNNQNNIIANFNITRWFQAYGIGDKYPFLYPLWFIRNLIVLNLLSFIIKKVIDFAPKIFLIIIIIMFLFVPSFPLDNFCSILYVNDFCFWCFGYYLIKYQININKFDKSKIIFLLFIICLIINTALKDFSFPIISVIISRFSLSVNIIFWYSCFSYAINCPLQKLLLSFSNYNFCIYIFHEMNLTFIRKVIAKFFGTSFYIQFFQYLLLPIFLAIIIVFVCIKLEKVLPNTFNVLTGNRIRKINV